MTKHILVVDDEKNIVDIIKAYLVREGYQVTTSYDGCSALKAAISSQPDLIILDLMLPEMSGWDVCKELRKTSNIPIIMLTARDETAEKIIGLEIGADDYITKPFDPKEVVSRVKAVLRRSSEDFQATSSIIVGSIDVDIHKRLVTNNGKQIELTPLEFDILHVLAASPGRVYSRMQLLDMVQGDAYEGYERTIDSHIKNLRKKLDVASGQPGSIITIYGVGYKMSEKHDT